jgi:hypothetical protein
MRKNKNVHVLLALSSVCALLIGIWAIQSQGSQANSFGPQQQLAAAATTPDVGKGGSTGTQPGQSSTGMPGQGGSAMKTPGSNDKSSDVGGIFCNRICLYAPDMWDLTCAPVCTYPGP